MQIVCLQHSHPCCSWQSYVPASPGSTRWVCCSSAAPAWEQTRISRQSRHCTNHCIGRRTDLRIGHQGATQSSLPLAWTTHQYFCVPRRNCFRIGIVVFGLEAAQSCIYCICSTSSSSDPRLTSINVLVPPETACHLTMQDLLLFHVLVRMCV